MSLNLNSGRRAAALMAMVAACCGCDRQTVERPPVHPTRGQLLVAGKPAAGATINFHSASGVTEKFVPTASVDTDGTFRVGTFAAGDGAPEGEYVVSIVWPKSNDPESDSAQGDRLRGRYADASKSKLKALVTAGDNQLPPFRIQ